MSSARTALVIGVTAAAGVALGVGVAPLVAGPAEVAPPPSPPTLEMTDEELRIACLPVMRRTATSLTEVQLQVDALSVRIRDKESEVERLEAELRGTADDRNDLAGRLVAARDDLSELQGELDKATQVAASLDATLAETREILQTTRAALSVQQQRTRAALDDASAQRWAAFVGEAQLTLCKAGNRLGTCRDVVETSLSRWERRYKDCVRSGAAVPQLRQLSPSEEMPSFAVMLDSSNVTTAGWYILFCDPSLPEAGGRRPPLEHGPDLKPLPPPG